MLFKHREKRECNIGYATSSNSDHILNNPENQMTTTPHLLIQNYRCHISMVVAEGRRPITFVLGGCFHMYVFAYSD